MKKKTSRFSAILLCVFLLFSVLCAPAAHANSAQMWFEGVSATGAVIKEDSPIEVESELLTFDIREFPQEYYATPEEYMDYLSTVTAEYTFVNPSEYTVTARLLFPFGNRPMYEGSSFVEGIGNVPFDDTEKFDITVNGEPIERKLRHTLSYPHALFDLERDLGRLTDDYVEDDFFTPDMLVTKYTYNLTVSEEAAETYPALNIAFDLKEFDGKRKYIFMEQSGLQSNGSLWRISAWAENKMTLTLYVIGKPLENDIQWRFYEDGGVDSLVTPDAEVTLASTEELTFKELCLTEYKEEYGVLESDWYNAMVLSFDSNTDDAGVIYVSDGFGMYIYDDLMRWYEYEITLEPGERIVNTVTAPLYPNIDLEYEPPTYKYVYLLSPAKTWASFGTLDIVINTDFYMTGEPTVGTWTKTDTGFSCSLSGLPDSELEFVLSSEENPQEPVRGITDYIPVELIISALVITGAVIILAVGIAVICWLVKRKRSKKL